jgi:ketosteroid isomerase-like protein
MTSSNGERVRALVEAMSAGRLETMTSRQLEPLLDILDTDVEIRPLLGNVEGEAYRGHEGFRRWFSQFTEVFEDFEVDVSAIDDLEGRVIASGTIHARARVSGAPISQPISWLLTLRDGKVVRVDTFGDRASAAQAARRAEPGGS